MSDTKVASIDDLTQLEQEMLGKGYASVRMVAAKLKRHYATVIRLTKDERGKGRHKHSLDSIYVGQQCFVPIESVVEYIGKDGSKLLELDDWSKFEFPVAS